MIDKRSTRFGWAIACIATFILAAAAPLAHAETGVTGWLNWRGPQQNGTSLETGLTEKWELGGAADLWSFDLRGRGTPVIASTPAGERVYTWGYRGEGANLQEVLACLDAQTGKPVWEHAFSDFLSDTVYDRYTIGAPTIDPATGNIFLCTTPGDLYCYSPDGKQLWKEPLMETLGRLTFPNSRTGAVVVDGDRVIVHCVASNWGSEGPVRDRFYAFDKTNGLLVWSSDPGVGPPFLKDNSFATPLLTEDAQGRRVFYCATGDGNLVGVNARTGQPLWRYAICMGGINSSPVLYKGNLIGVHSLENVDSSKSGRMVAVNVSATPKPAEAPAGSPPGTPAGTATLERTAEAWRNDDISMFSSSPVLAGDRVFQLDTNGVLWCVDAATGKTLWTKKLGNTQIHASPLFADGKLYVPMNDGEFYILRPTDKGADELCKVKLGGNCLGSPAVWNGKIYVHTTEKLYCFGVKDNAKNLPTVSAIAAAETKPGAAKSLHITPMEVLLRPGEKQAFTVTSIDAAGNVVAAVTDAKWEHFVPATAKVKAAMDAEFEGAEMVAGPAAKISAGSWKATAGEIFGTTRGRVLPKLPYNEDFEKTPITNDHATEAGVKFAYPPLPWIGGRFKWEIRQFEGSNVLVKTTDNVMLIRAMTFIGHPDEHNYTMQADVRTDGNRRMKGEVGIINQRYLFTIDGNADVFRLSSNLERINVGVPLKVEAKAWYTIKTRVDANADGSGIVRGKIWKRGEAEPEKWTIEFTHDHVHAQGAPGVFGFSPQPVARVYLDNLSITPNK